MREPMGEHISCRPLESPSEKGPFGEGRSRRKHDKLTEPFQTDIVCVVLRRSESTSLKHVAEHTLEAVVLESGRHSLLVG